MARGRQHRMLQAMKIFGLSCDIGRTYSFTASLGLDSEPSDTFSPIIRGPTKEESSLGFHQDAWAKAIGIAHLITGITHPRVRRDVSSEETTPASQAQTPSLPEVQTIAPVSADRSDLIKGLQITDPTPAAQSVPGAQPGPPGTAATPADAQQRYRAAARSQFRHYASHGCLVAVCAPLSHR